MGIGHPAGTRGNRATDTKHLGTATNSQRNALIQLLAAQGIVLGDYVGGHAYWALVRDGAKLQGLWQGNRPTSLVAVKPEWKLAEELQHGKIPSHAQVGTAGVRVVIRYAPNATPT